MNLQPNLLVNFFWYTDENSNHGTAITEAHVLLGATKVLLAGMSEEMDFECGWGWSFGTPALWN